jgi:hypothetical protein
MESELTRIVTVTSRNSPTARSYNATEVSQQRKRNTLQSRLFEFPFRASRCAVVSVVSMFGTQFSDMRFFVCSRVSQALL